MISVISAIIYAIMAAVGVGMAVAYSYERKLREDAYSENEGLSDRLQKTEQECRAMRMELSRLDGVAQGRECDAMQRKFLESMQQNGQGVVRLRGQRHDA